MGSESTPLIAREARHLLRRTGFGASQAQIDAFTNLTRGAAADALLNFRPSKFKPGGRYIDQRLISWVKYMIATPLQLQEKLVLFWHDHFAASNTKVNNPRTMADQNALFRKFCKGNFKDFVKAVNKDPAMLEFLDTVRNNKDQPNENYARELQELFTLGVKDLNGTPNYTQEDIVQIARGFTGWSYTNHHGNVRTVFNDGDHDYAAAYPERGAKVVYQTTGGFGSSGRDFTINGEGQPEVDAIVDSIFDHKDSDGHRTVARFITGKLLTYFAQPGAKRPVAAALKGPIDEIIANSRSDPNDANSTFDKSWDLQALLRAMFVHDSFYDTAAPVPFTANTKKSVKCPVDYVVGTLRMLRMKLGGRYGDVRGGAYRSVHDHLQNMGQHLFEPPSVFGWDWETSWLSSSTLLARYAFARDIGDAFGSTPTKLRPFQTFRQEPLVDPSLLNDPAGLVDAVAKALGVDDQLLQAELDLLVNYASGGNPVEKTFDVFVILMQSPAYQVH